MRILLDTNVVIQREDNSIIPEKIKKLEQRFQKSSAKIYVHPESLKDLYNDNDHNRKNIIKSKFGTYLELDDPPNFQGDNAFLSQLPKTSKQNDTIDNHILYSIYRDAIDFLVTEDKQLIKKASKLNIKERVFNIDEIIDFLHDLDHKEIRHDIAIHKEKVHNLPIKDPIFDKLKERYDKFEDWWKKICREGREAFVYYKEYKKQLGAILVLKIEDEGIELSDKNLPKEKRIKICTLNVISNGYKIGELFLKMAFEFGIKNNIFQVYLTHFVNNNSDHDYLIDLISLYGFKDIGKSKTSSDSIFLKILYTSNIDKSKIKDYYPCFLDDREVQKFLVPIQPRYHERLFPDYPANIDKRTKQLFLFYDNVKPIVEGNTITKAYLCHSKSKKVKAEDIIIFYRSQDIKTVTTLCIVEQVEYGIVDADKAWRIVGKRSVYTEKEIQDLVKKGTKGTTIILFKYHFHIAKNIANHQITAPQSIKKISCEQYQQIKQSLGEKYGRFAISQTTIC